MSLTRILHLNGFSNFTRSSPILPNPIIPTVLPVISLPTLIFHILFFRSSELVAMFLNKEIDKAKVNSATDLLLVPLE